MIKQSHPVLRKLLTIVKKNTPINRLVFAFRVLIWELMKIQTKLNKFDKQIVCKKKSHMKQKTSPMPIKGKIGKDKK